MVIDSHEHVILPTENQIELMDQSKIDKAILFTTTPHPEQSHSLQELKQQISMLSSVLNRDINAKEKKRLYENNIKDLTTAMNYYPDRFLGFGNIPLGMKPFDIELWIDKQICRNHLMGLGEFTPSTIAQIQQIGDIMKIVYSNRIYPLWIHTFLPVTKEMIFSLVDLCKKFPTVPIIFGHLGGTNWMELIELAKTVPNIYLDLSAQFTSIATKMALLELPERCLFSSDAPYGDPFLYRQMIEYLSPSKTITNLVLGENIMELLTKLNLL